MFTSLSILVPIVFKIRYEEIVWPFSFSQKKPDKAQYTLGNTIHRRSFVSWKNFIWGNMKYLPKERGDV